MSSKQKKSKSEKGDIKNQNTNSASSISSNKEVDYITREQNISTLKENLERIDKDNSKIISQLKEFSKPDPILESFKNLDNYKDYKLDDDVFEQKIIDLLEKRFYIESFDYFPLFEVNFSKKYKKKVTSINYYKITIYEENMEKLKEYNFIANRKCLSISCSDYTIIININDINNYGYSIISKDFRKAKDKTFENKDGNIYISSFYRGEIENENFIMENNKKQIQKKYKELNEYFNQSKEKFEFDKAKEVMNIINILNTNESKITIYLEKISKELDGFFITKKEIKLTSIVDDQNKDIIIPENSYLIVEVKNFNNIQKIKKNLYEKRRILVNIGINLKNAYFLGIINSEHILDNNQKYHLNKENDLKKNIIIVYPELLGFLNENICVITNSEEHMSNIIKDKVKEAKKQEISSIAGNFYETIRKIIREELAKIKKE